MKKTKKYFLSVMAFIVVLTVLTSLSFISVYACGTADGKINNQKAVAFKLGSDGRLPTEVYNGSDTETDAESATSSTDGTVDKTLAYILCISIGVIALCVVITYPIYKKKALKKCEEENKINEEK